MNVLAVVVLTDSGSDGKAPFVTGSPPLVSKYEDVGAPGISNTTRSPKEIVGPPPRVNVTTSEVRVDEKDFVNSSILLALPEPALAMSTRAAPHDPNAVEETERVALVSVNSFNTMQATSTPLVACVVIVAVIVVPDVTPAALDTAPSPKTMMGDYGLTCWVMAFYRTNVEPHAASATLRTSPIPSVVAWVVRSCCSINIAQHPSPMDVYLKLITNFQ
jgi:hypothetical protein